MRQKRASRKMRKSCRNWIKSETGAGADSSSGFGTARKMRIATAMMTSPDCPKICWAAAVPTRSCGAVWISGKVRTVMYATLART